MLQITSLQCWRVFICGNKTVSLSHSVLPLKTVNTAYALCNLALAKNICNMICISDLCSGVKLRLSQWNWNISAPSVSLFLCFIFYPFSPCGSLSREGHSPPTCPTKAACGWGERPSLLPSPCWESRGGMSFHASKTTSLNSSTDLFYCVDEPFTFSQDLFSILFFFSPKSLIPTLPVCCSFSPPCSLSTSSKLCWPLLLILKLLIDFLCHLLFFLYPLFFSPCSIFYQQWWSLTQTLTPGFNWP